MSIKIISLTVLLVCSIVGSDEVRKELTSHRSWWLVDREDNCGIPRSSMHKIVGGTLTDLGMFPWIVILYYIAHGFVENSVKVRYDCGGTIVSRRYVITAAHCDPKKDERPDFKGPLEWGARVGEYDVQTNPDCFGDECAPLVQDIDVEEYYCHSHLSYTFSRNDICLLRLKTNIVYSAYVRPICLPVYSSFIENNFVGMEMEVAGWGKSFTYSTYRSPKLLYVTLPVVSPRNCARLYRDIGEVNSKSMICAGGVKGEDSCNGDSGNALMGKFSLDGKPLKYFMVGIVSYGPYECGVSSLPGIYTRVSHYLTWILDHMKE